MRVEQPVNIRQLVSLFMVSSAVLVSGMTPAAAAVLSWNFGNPADDQYFTAQGYAEIKSAGDVVLDDAGLRHNDSIPLYEVSESGILGANGTSVSYSAYATLDGFGLGRAAATLQVSDAINLNGAYNAVASLGSRTQVQFYSGDTPGQAVFNFSVTGTSVAPYGSAIGRMDFLARPFTSGSGSFFDVFTDPAAMNGTGPGNYSFTYIGSLANPLDVMFYSAAVVLIGLQDPANLGLPPNGATFSASANYANSVTLTQAGLMHQWRALG